MYRKLAKKNTGVPFFGIFSSGTGFLFCFLFIDTLGTPREWCESNDNGDDSRVAIATALARLGGEVGSTCSRARGIQQQQQQQQPQPVLLVLQRERRVKLIHETNLINRGSVVSFIFYIFASTNPPDDLRKKKKEKERKRHVSYVPTTPVALRTQPLHYSLP